MGYFDEEIVARIITNQYLHLKYPEHGPKLQQIIKTGKSYYLEYYCETARLFPYWKIPKEQKQLKYTVKPLI